MSIMNGRYIEMKSIVSFWNRIQPKRYSYRSWATHYTLHHCLDKAFNLRSSCVKLWLSQCGLPVIFSHFHAKMKLLLLFTSVAIAHPTPPGDWCGLSSSSCNYQQSSQSPWQLLPFYPLRTEIEHWEQIKIKNSSWISRLAKIKCLPFKMFKLNKTDTRITEGGKKKKKAGRTIL